MAVSVIGLGYIGLPLAALLATSGFHVHGVDTNPRVLNSVRTVDSYESEPLLQPLLHQALENKTLSLFAEPQPSDFFIIAVPTPVSENHKPDLSFVASACASLAQVLQPGNVVILESTSPIGATEDLCRQLKALRPDLCLPGDIPERLDCRVYVAYCPERTLPGNILAELRQNDRIIGGLTPPCAEQAKKLYDRFVTGEIVLTDAKTAEMVKLVENAYRDVNIAFANELSMICDARQADVFEVIRLANRHPRVNIHTPGPGVGGHCVGVDPWFLVDGHPDATTVIQAARQVNQNKTRFVLNQILTQLEQQQCQTVACLGLSYKPNSPDLRESPALEIVSSLAAVQPSLRILITDPHIHTLPSTLAGFPNVTLTSLEEAIARSDRLFCLVGHTAFKPLVTDDEKSVINLSGAWQ